MLSARSGGLDAPAPAAAVRVPLGSEVPWPRAVVIACTVVSLAAIAMRAAAFLSGRSLWMDEIALAQNILSRSYGGLTQPLDGAQGAPLLFLFGLKWVTQVFGTSEYALRLIPFVMGIVSVPLFLPLARRLLSPAAGLVAVALFGTAEPLVYYAGEMKQYSTDVTVTLLLLLALLPLLQRRFSMLHTVAVALLGAVAVWASHPACLTIAGALTVALVAAWRDGSRSRLVSAAVIAATSGLSFVLSYVLFLRHLQQNAFLTKFWSDQGGFLELPLSPANVVRTGKTLLRIGRDLFSFPTHDLGKYVWAISIAALLAGGWMLARRAPRRFWFILGPVLACVGASFLRQYPFAGRLILFLHPLFFLLIGAGAGLFCEGATGSVDSDGTQGANRVRRAKPGLPGVAFAALLVLPIAAGGVATAVNPPNYHDCGPVLTFLRERAEPGDTVFLSRGSMDVWDYYARSYGLAGMRTVRWEALPEDPAIHGSPMPENLLRLEGLGRVWILHVFPCEAGDGVPEVAITPLVCDQIGRRIAERRSRLARVFLYEFPPRLRERM